MKPRSPILGFNHNVRHRGRVYHVQTEDSGVGNPHLFTHLFVGGTILASKRCDYDPTSSREVVRSLMQSQHKAMMRELRQGHLDERLSQFFADRGEPSAIIGGEPSGVIPIEPTQALEPSLAPQPMAVEEEAIPDDPYEPPPQMGPSDLDQSPVILLTPPPVPVRRAPATATGAIKQMAQADVLPSHTGDPGVRPVEVTIPETSIAQALTELTSSGQHDLSEAGMPDPLDEDLPVVVLAPPRAPTTAPAAVAHPQPPSASRHSTVGRRIWARKGGSSEKMFPTPAPVSSDPGTGLTTHRAPAAPMAPAPEEEGPVVVLAPAPSAMNRRAPAGPSAATSPTANPSAPRRSASLTPVSTRSPSADGVVIARPAIVVGGTPQQERSAAGRAGAAPPARGAAAVPQATPQGRAPVQPPREAPDSIFGEDLKSEKSLDEVILAYLAEEAKPPK